jgi:hypothetical protein
LLGKSFVILLVRLNAVGLGPLLKSYVAGEAEENPATIDKTRITGLGKTTERDLGVLQHEIIQWISLQILRGLVKMKKKRASKEGVAGSLVGLVGKTFFSFRYE